MSSRYTREVLFGYAAKILAGLLLPKCVPCHQKFTLAIDILLFVGHSVCADTDSTWHFKVEKEVRSCSVRLAMMSCRPPSLTLHQRAAPWWGAQGLVD
jgi:hypothetical protein